MKTVSKRFRINKRQFWIYNFVRYGIGKVFSDRIGLGVFILYDKKTGKKLYFNNLSYVEEQVQCIYEFSNKLKLSKGKNIVDIGAACGEYTYNAVTKGCNVFAVEIDPQRYNYLFRNLREFETSRNVKLMNKPVGLREDCIRLDDLKHNFKKIDILKVDVDGDEYNVLRSGMRTLDKSRCVIMECEYDFVKKQSISLLLKKGFKIKTKNTLVYAYKN